MTEEQKPELQRNLEALADLLNRNPLQLGAGPHTAVPDPDVEDQVMVKDRNGLIRAIMHKDTWEALRSGAVATHTSRLSSRESSLEPEEARNARILKELFDVLDDGDALVSYDQLPDFVRRLQKVIKQAHELTQQMLPLLTPQERSIVVPNGKLLTLESLLRSAREKSYHEQVKLSDRLIAEVIAEEAEERKG